MNKDYIDEQIEILLGTLPDLLYKRLYFKNKDTNLFKHFDTEVTKTLGRLDFLFRYKSFDYLNK